MIKRSIQNISIFIVTIMTFAICFKTYADEYTDKVKNLAQQYYWGVERKKDLSKALQLYLEAAEKGDNEAKYIAGGMYYRGFGTSKDFKKAFTLLYGAAISGNSTKESQKLLGQFFLTGTSTPRNYAEAMKWFKMAAENGDREAQSELAFLYFTGKAGIKDAEKAFYWYDKSARQGLAVAQYSLGIMYYTGNGVQETDAVSAYSWLSLAAMQNHTIAKEAVAYLETVFDHNELVLAQNRAKELYESINEELR